MKQRVMDLAHAAGLSRLADELEELMLDAIRIRTKRVRTESLEIGASRFGGTPDLPPELNWPQWNDLPLSFIAQIRLSDLKTMQRATVAPDITQLALFEVAPLAGDSPAFPGATLPQSGILYFFWTGEAVYRQDQGLSADWNGDPRAWRVLYHEDMSSLVRTTWPEGLTESVRYVPCGLTFLHEVTLPSSDSLYVSRLELTAEEEEAYGDLLYDLQAVQGSGDSERCHRLLGHPWQLQGDMQEECQRRSQGDVGEDGVSLVNARAGEQEQERQALNWRMLLQLETDAEPGFDWGGVMYYWMPPPAMRAARFDQTWLILQYD